MDDSIKQKLSGLLLLLSNPDIKSKQAAFNASYDELTHVKEFVSWEKIVEIIKQETGITFDARTASNMYGRTRRKHEPEVGSRMNTISKSEPKDTKAPDVESKNENVVQKKISNPAELRTLRNRHIDLDDLKDGD